MRFLELSIYFATFAKNFGESIGHPKLRQALFSDSLSGTQSK